MTLRAAGAIIIGKTNVAQALATFDCANPLWGCTCNPWSAAHTAGGSSGGEGALLAADGAVLGIGSDAGGSIRIPSGYCGIFGFKPGHGRVSYAGNVGASLVAPQFPFWLADLLANFFNPFPVLFRAVADPNPGFEVVRVVAGPMARSVVDLERMARVLFGEHGGREGYFPAPVPYRDVALPDKLRFGYYLNGASSATLVNNGLMRI
jgi:Asp-tRNA(Asn)/Glu-tRNA(Gln) amidotransferase A subunit family amidase